MVPDSLVGLDMRCKFAWYLAVLALAACRSPGATGAGGDPVSEGVRDAADDLELPVDAAFPSPAPVGCVTSVEAGDHSFACNGLTHDVSVPQQCLQGPCGLILDIHGLTMDGLMEDRNTNLRALGSQHGYVVVQPNANPAPPASSWVTDVDDAKILAFLDDVQAAWHIDPGRVHVTGFSQGGLMTWRFVCKNADRFASAAPGAACNHQDEEACPFAGPATPSRRIPLLYMHGRFDVFFDFPEAEAQRDLVVATWGLHETATLSSDAHHAWTRYADAAGTVFEFVWHDYLAAPSTVLQGHCYPGSTDPGDAPGQIFSYRCEDAAAFTWGEIVMQFFLDHPMRDGGSL